MSIKEAVGLVASASAMQASKSIADTLATSVIGAPAWVIGAAFIGSVISFFFGEPAKSHKELVKMAIAGTVVGSVVSALLPYAWEWAREAQAPIAILAAITTRHWLPIALARGGELIKSFNPFNMFKKKEDTK